VKRRSLAVGVRGAFVAIGGRQAPAEIMNVPIFFPHFFVLQDMRHSLIYQPHRATKTITDSFHDAAL
jgi:hypothetical protein